MSDHIRQIPESLKIVFARGWRNTRTRTREVSTRTREVGTRTREVSTRTREVGTRSRTKCVLAHLCYLLIV